MYFAINFFFAMNSVLNIRLRPNWLFGVGLENSIQFMFYSHISVIDSAMIQKVKGVYQLNLNISWFRPLFRFSKDSATYYNDRNWFFFVRLQFMWQRPIISLVSQVSVLSIFWQTISSNIWEKDEKRSVSI